MKKRLSRRNFLKKSAYAGAGVSLGLSLAVGSFPLTGCGEDEHKFKNSGISGYKNRWKSPGPYRGGKNIPKVIIISIDALDPRILYLDEKGEKGGRDGHWLMPNVRRFLSGGVWFENSRCWMPSATDMNHLNAVAGTSSAQTGIFGVSMQFFDWNPDGTPNIKPPSLSFARDDLGRPVDTIMSAFKRKWPSSRTLYSSGKGWVAEMFRTKNSGVDMILTGRNHPEYVPPPQAINFYDPPGDEDAGDDAESWLQKTFYNRGYAKRPMDFPPDHWVVGATLKVMEKESPDFSVIVLAEMDDSQHGLGTVVNPGDFISESTFFNGGVLVSRYNSGVYKEAVLDSMRNIDRQFKRLVDGIEKLPAYKDALVVFYSDHGHITHRDTLWSNFDPRMETDSLKVLYSAGVITKKERRGIGVFPFSASGVCGLYINGTIKERRRRAVEFKQALAAHKIWDRYSGEYETPWYIVGEEETKKGIPGVCEPGELFHKYFAYNDRPGTPHMMDLGLFMKKGYQTPICQGMVHNLGIKLPWYCPESVNLMLGGHGSYDTKEIVMFMKGPGIKKGKVVKDPEFSRDFRISDIAVTLGKRLGLSFRSTTIGKDRTGDLI